MKRKQRKRNYVDAAVQGGLLRRILAHWFIFFVVTAFLVIALQALLGDPSKSLSERLQQEAYEFTFLGIVLLSVFPAFLLDTIRFSNRFVGPIVRVRRQLRELAKDGDTATMKFRDHDFWTDMADEFNEVVILVRRQRQEIDTLKTKLEEAKVEV